MITVLGISSSGEGFHFHHDFFLYYRKKRGDPKVLGGITNSVSFRQGTNVEFEGPSFVGVAEAAAHKNPADADFTLGTISSDASSRDFSNPMYDMQAEGAGPPAV